MLGRSPEQIAPAAAGMHLTDEPKLRKYFEGAIDGNQPDAGVFSTHPFIYGGGGKVVMIMGNHLQHCATLWGQLIATLP